MDSGMNLTADRSLDVVKTQIHEKIKKNKKKEVNDAKKTKKEVTRKDTKKGKKEGKE